MIDWGSSYIASPVRFTCPARCEAPVRTPSQPGLRPARSVLGMFGFHSVTSSSFTCRCGLVTRTMARLRLPGKMADDDLVRPPSIPAYDHPARRLALCPLHAQLSRRRGSTAGARSGCLLRDGAAMGLEVRAVVRPRTSQSTAAANGAVASRRDGRDDCGQAVLALARGRRRRRDSRSAGATTARQGAALKLMRKLLKKQGFAPMLW